MLSRLFFRALVAVSVFFCFAASAGEMSFQFSVSGEHAMSVKLFSQGDSKHVWPSVTKAYSLQPDPTVQLLKISCKDEEPICWGAFMVVQSESGLVGTGGQRNTRTIRASLGVGERGNRPCEKCCHVCKADHVVPVVRLGRVSDPSVK